MPDILHSRTLVGCPLRVHYTGREITLCTEIYFELHDPVVYSVVYSNMFIIDITHDYQYYFVVLYLKLAMCI